MAICFTFSARSGGKIDWKRRDAACNDIWLKDMLEVECPFGAPASSFKSIVAQVKPTAKGDMKQ